MQELIQQVRTEIRGTWRYRWIAMITAWLVCGLGWSFVFTMPDIFEARARVFVDADSRLADVMGEVGVAPGVNSRVYIVRQAMLGLPQLERVARETDLDLRARTPEEKEQLLVGLKDRIGVGTGRTQQSQNLYTITFEDRDRDMAVAVVQTLLDTFVEDVLKLKGQGSEDVTGYLEDQLNHYSGLLSASERSLSDFKKKYVGLLPGDNGGIFERLQTEMSAQALLRAELQIQEDRRIELRRQLQSETPDLPEGAAQGAGAALPGSTTQGTITALENRRAELLLAFTERHPDVVAIEEQLEQLYRQREADRYSLSNSGGIEGASNATNPVYQSVQIALNETGVRIAGLRSQVLQADASVRRLNDQINTIPEVEAEYAQLTRNYDQYNSLYQELLVKKERERMGTVGDDRDVVSFNIIEPPAASFEPVAPKRGILLAGVMILGLGAGAALAFLVHLLNPVFHDARTLRNVIGRPVLGIVSMTWLERHKIARRVDFSTFALAGTTLAVVFVMTILLKNQLVGLMNSLIWQVTG